MRALLLVMLMLLMPLRAWAGDTMALSMLHGQGHPPATSMASEPAGQQDHADHAGHAGDDGHDAHLVAAEADNPCPTHTACDLCNGPLMNLAGWKADPVPARHRLQAAPAVHFASLVPPRHHKPPIA